MESSNVEALETNLADTAQLPARVAAVGPSAAETDEWDDRNHVFQRLVTADDDIVGLVAYSVYKQNKLDWLLAFEKQRGRAPDEAELSAYILGESTPRRLATYRHLAESTLKGSGLNARDNIDRPGVLPYGGASAGFVGNSTISYLILAGVVLIAIFLAARFGLVAK